MSERTQVAIIGAGPAGLLLSHLLHQIGIESVILERQTRDYVEARVRAGVIEPGVVAIMKQAGVIERLEAEGLAHEGIEIALNGVRQTISFKTLINKVVTIYGQTEITKDMGKKRDSLNGLTHYNVQDITLHDCTSSTPFVHFKKDGEAHTLQADFIIGCDGYYGISRQHIPDIQCFDHVYPFAWLGIMAHVPPPSDELIYARHDRGFALCSMRSKTLSRHYLQVSPDTNLEDWSADRIWSEIGIRIGDPQGKFLKTGELIEKSLVPMRSFVCETVRHGRLFLCGDAAHIVPPTGAKGLNLASSDVFYLSKAISQFYQTGSEEGLNDYSPKMLARVWKAQQFSRWMTYLLHPTAGGTSFDDKIRGAEAAYLLSSTALQTALSENYTGLPL